jgi:heme/copper-type cytochrome/quinol oxidase subunit 3
MLLFMKKAAPSFICYILLSVLIATSKLFLSSMGINASSLIFANTFFCLISLISIAIQLKAHHNKNPHVFFRAIMGTMLFKMATTVVALFIYISLSNGNFNKRDVFVSLFFYLIYLAIEVFILTRMNKNKNV